MEYKIDEMFPIGATMFTDVFDYVDTIFLLACENTTAFLAENSASKQYPQTVIQFRVTLLTVNKSKDTIGCVTIMNKLNNVYLP